jgi:hypothetical protein
MLSDECSVERGAGKSVEWCFGNPADKWKPRFAKTHKKSKDIQYLL